MEQSTTPPATEPPITLILTAELGNKLRAVMVHRATKTKSQMLRTFINDAWLVLPDNT